MSKLIFSSNDIRKDSKEFVLGFPDQYKKLQPIDSFIDFELDKETGDVVGRYSGPTIEEITEEIEFFKKEQKEKAILKLKEAKEQASKMIEQAKERVNQITNIAENEKDLLLKEAEHISKEKIQEADLYLERKKQEASLEVNKIHKEAYDEGYKEGLQKGFDLSNADISVLLVKLEDIIQEALLLREQILKDSEKQLVNIVMMIAYKVIKDESTQRKDVVIKQVKDILHKVGSSTDVTIRVNMADINIAISYKEEFLHLLSTLKSIKVVEDSTVDRGGVIFNTQYGTIDARISTQFRKIEHALEDVKMSI